jgi:hypothetical protein
MPYAFFISVAGYTILISVLIYWGMFSLSEYFSRGQYAKNITHLLGGAGLLALAASCLLSTTVTRALVFLASTQISVLLVTMSSLLLLSSIVVFGSITYGKPLRLWHERRLGHQLRNSSEKLN